MRGVALVQRPRLAQHTGERVHAPIVTGCSRAAGNPVVAGQRRVW
jgi:hypothetical protein